MTLEDVCIPISSCLKAAWRWRGQAKLSLHAEVAFRYLQAHKGGWSDGGGGREGCYK
jgi:hypothetical protein